MTWESPCPSIKSGSDSLARMSVAPASMGNLHKKLPDQKCALSPSGDPHSGGCSPLCPPGAGPRWTPHRDWQTSICPKGWTMPAATWNGNSGCRPCFSLWSAPSCPSPRAGWGAGNPRHVTSHKWSLIPHSVLSWKLLEMFLLAAPQECHSPRRREFHPPASVGRGEQCQKQEGRVAFSMFTLHVAGGITSPWTSSLWR